MIANRGMGFFLAAVFALLIGLMSPFAWAAQGNVETSKTEARNEGVLAEFDFNQVPSRHAEVWFMRISLRPEGTFPMWWKSAIMLFYVEEGSLAIEAGGPVMRSGSRTSGPQQLTLSSEDSMLAPADVLVEMSNPTEEQATFLMVLMIFTTGDDETQRQVDDPSGYTLTRLSYGTAEFQLGPATITIDRVVVPPGESHESPSSYRTDLGYGWMGLDAGAVETGIGRAEILHRSEQGTMMRPDQSGISLNNPPVKFETALTFPAGWGYFFYNAEIAWASTGDQPLTILRVIVNPQIGE